MRRMKERRPWYGYPHYRAGEETPLDVLLHGWVPAALAALSLCVSLAADWRHPGAHWTMRAGSIVTLLGAYVGFRDAKVRVVIVKTRDGLPERRGIRISNDGLPYGGISLVLLIVGCLVWGYGDRWL